MNGNIRSNLVEISKLQLKANRLMATVMFEHFFRLAVKTCAKRCGLTLHLGALLLALTLGACGEDVVYVEVENTDSDTSSSDDDTSDTSADDTADTDSTDKEPNDSETETEDTDTDPEGETCVQMVCSLPAYPSGNWFFDKTICSNYKWSFAEYTCVRITWTEEAHAMVTDMTPTELKIQYSLENPDLPLAEGQYIKYVWHQVVPDRYDGISAEGSNTALVDLPYELHPPATAIRDVDYRMPLIIHLETDIEGVWWGWDD